MATRALVHCLIVFFIASLCSCAQDLQNQLSGSVRKLGYSLDFKTVEVRWYDGYGIQIVYSSPIPNSIQRNEAVNLFIDNDGVDLKAGVLIDLKRHATLQRFFVDPATFQEDTRLFPPILDGSTIEFYKFSVIPGQPMSGQFQIVFGGGYLLKGDFNASLTMGNPADL